MLTFDPVFSSNQTFYESPNGTVLYSRQNDTELVIYLAAVSSDNSNQLGLVFTIANISSEKLSLEDLTTTKTDGVRSELRSAEFSQQQALQRRYEEYIGAETNPAYSAALATVGQFSQSANQQGRTSMRTIRSVPGTASDITGVQLAYYENSEQFVIEPHSLLTGSVLLRLPKKRDYSEPYENSLKFFIGNDLHLVRFTIEEI